MKLSLAKFALFAVSIVFAWFSPATALAEDASVQIALPILSVRNYGHLPAADVTPATPPALGIIVTVTGRPNPIRLPISADTYLVKGKTEAVGDAELLVLQDGRTVVLLQPDLSPLAGVKQEEIQDATLAFTVGWKQKDGSATFSVHRMLTAWTEDATWVSPRADATWAGPVADVDFEKSPLASFKAPALKAGVIQVPSLAAAVKHWLAGDWPANGLLLQMTGSVGAGECAFARTRGPQRRRDRRRRRTICHDHRRRCIGDRRVECAVAAAGRVVAHGREERRTPPEGSQQTTRQALHR